MQRGYIGLILFLAALIFILGLLWGSCHPNYAGWLSNRVVMGSLAKTTNIVGIFLFAAFLLEILVILFIGQTPRLMKVTDISGLPRCVNLRVMHHWVTNETNWYVVTDKSNRYSVVSLSHALPEETFRIVCNDKMDDYFDVMIPDGPIYWKVWEPPI